jgi:large subunit ribosomal protein L25
VSEVRITAEPRTEFGKGAARRVRRSNKVPAVIYGHGAQPRHVSLPGHDLMLALKKGANTLLRVDVEGDSELVLPRNIAKDPIKGYYEHLDLVLVRSGERQTVDIRVTLTGESRSDVLVDQQSITLSVEAEVTHIPDEVQVDVSRLGVGDSVTAGDVTLPEGVTLAGAPEHVLVQGLAAPTAAQIDSELAASEAQTGAGQQVAEAAPPAATAGTGNVVPADEA